MLHCHLSRTRHDIHTLPFRTSMQIHETDELTYFISGEGTTEIAGTVLPYQKGTFAFYRAGTVHNEVDPVPCEVIWTHFTVQIDGISLREGVFEDPHGELLLLLRKLRRLSLEESPYRDILVESCLSEIAVTAALLQQETPPERTSADWQAVVDFIDRNSNTEIDFEALAARSHYSYHRFRHLFTEKFGVPPYAYLLRRRIEHATLMLQSTTLSLTEIAYDCGFASSSQFSNIFKKHLGMTPTAYREDARESETRIPNPSLDVATLTCE